MEPPSNLLGGHTHGKKYALIFLSNQISHTRKGSRGGIAGAKKPTLHVVSITMSKR